ncbi:MAG TPA: ABC transporter substrate-binding protein [Anaerolineae bacterium]|nr:ABC transporter substrate-binding protein [Anaerolineae bacterium]
MKTKGVLALLVLVSVLVMSCGPTAAPETAVSAEPTQVVVAEPTEAVVAEPTGAIAAEPTEAAAPAAKTRLTLAHAWPARVDPAIGNDNLALTLYPNIYDTLIFPTPEGTPSAWIAESWDVSDDMRTYTFHLRQGVKFHDGSELLASDVVFSANRLLTIGQGLAYLISKHVESVTAPDDYTVQFVIKQPNALFVMSLVRLYILNEDEVMAHLEKPGDYGDFGDYGTKWLLTSSAASGPYKVKEVQLEEYVLLEKNTEWWAADQFVENAPDEVRFVPSPKPATLKTLMANRELEMSDQWQSAETIKSADEIEGVDVAAFDAVIMMHIYMHTKKAPTDDLHCRRAIAYAFDYETAAAIDWETTQPARAPVPAVVAGADLTLTPYAYDLDMAREELAQCKYADSIADYPVQLHWITEVPAEEKWALLVQAGLAQIGVNVEVTGTPWLTVKELASKPETTPNMFIILQKADLPDAGAVLLQRWGSATAGTTLQGEWLQDAQFDAGIADALATLDQEERFQKYAELQEYIMGLSPAIFGFDQLQKYAYQTYLDWPAAKGTIVPVMGYNQFMAFIGVSPH